MNEQTTPKPIVTQENLPLVLSIEDLCQVLRIGKNSAYALVKTGDISSLKIGRNIRIPRAALQKFLSMTE